VHRHRVPNIPELVAGGLRLVLFGPRDMGEGAQGVADALRSRPGEHSFASVLIDDFISDFDPQTRSRRWVHPPTDVL
jgi:hypothetical protein